MIAKKIQSNICGMLKSFGSAVSAIYGCHTPKLRAYVHVWFTRAGQGHDTLYVAFALAMGATNVVVADGPFVKAMARHPDPALARILLPLGDWAKAYEA